MISNSSYQTYIVILGRVISVLKVWGVWTQERIPSRISREKIQPKLCCIWEQLRDCEYRLLGMEQYCRVIQALDQHIIARELHDNEVNWSFN